MGKTYRHQGNSKYDDEHTKGRKGKHHSHSNNRKTGGMRIINDIKDDDEVFDEGDDYFQDEIVIEDKIVINKTSEQDPT